MEKFLKKNLWLPYHFRGCKKETLDLLKESQWWPEETKNKYISEQLEELIIFSQQQVPYYKTYPAISETDMMQAIKSLPVITKEILKKNADQFNPQIPEKKYTIERSGGTTGDPLILKRSMLSSKFIAASFYRFHHWHGIGPEARHVLIWGGKRPVKPEKNIYCRLRDLFLVPPLVIYSSEFETKNPKEWIKIITNYKPEYFRGYPSALKQFAEYIGNETHHIKKLKLKAVILTAEMVFQQDNVEISGHYHTKTIREYGARDGGLIALECEKGNLHLQDESVFAFTRPDHSIVITEMHNFAMPVINYELGDCVTFSNEKCSCGRTSKVISQILGRKSDMVRLSDGTLKSPYLIDEIIQKIRSRYGIACIKKYMAIQNEKGITFQIIPGTEHNNHIDNEIIAETTEATGLHHVSVLHVDSLETTSAGKYRNFKSAIL